MCVDILIKTFRVMEVLAPRMSPSSRPRDVKRPEHEVESAPRPYEPRGSKRSRRRRQGRGGK